MPKGFLSQKTFAAILGLFLSLILLEFGVRITGFVFSFLQEQRNRISVQQKGTYRIMCVGESTTAVGGENSYPYQLQEILNQRNIGVKFSVINKGMPSGNTTAILAELEDNLNTYRPDMVIAMIGANDGGDYALYKEGFDSKKIDLSRVFRTYKLAKFLWFYVVNKNAAISGGNSGRDIADVINDPGMPRSRKEVEATARKIFYTASPGLDLFILANDYMAQARYKEASECYEKVIEMGFLKEILKIHPKNIWIYYSLGECYKKQGRYNDAEEMYKKIVEVLPDIGFAELAALYKEEGEYKLAEEYSRKAREFKKWYYNALTRHNYQKLKEILDLRKIKLVSVQYPTCSLEPLRRMLSPKEGIIFVDNEIIFKKAISMGGYNKYFVDNCFGDFGHCTKEGNNLLAGNIANHILREAFSK
jgi:tetratricopeptide (TPR) repeat protein